MSYNSKYTGAEVEGLLDKINRMPEDGESVQTLELNKGYNWVSFNVETSLSALQNALGDKGISIGTSDDGTATANIVSTYNTSTGLWEGNLTSIDCKKMYQIRVSEECVICVTGKKLNISDIALNPGWNWIAYPLNEELLLADILDDLVPSEDDMFKAHDIQMIYINDYGWYGNLTSLQPGKGYMYLNNSDEIKHLVFPSNTIDFSVFETKTDAQAKLQEAKNYTDSQIAKLKEGIVTQTIELQTGYNLVSFYVDSLEGASGLKLLQDALGDKATRISSRSNGYLEYIVNPNTSFIGWGGDLETLDLTSAYMIEVTEPITISFTGKKVNPSDYPITLPHGWSWISFFSTEEMPVAEALSNLVPNDGDVIKNHAGIFSTYIEGYGWTGGLILEPNQGYQYHSESSETKTFTYPSATISKADLDKKQNQLVSGENIKTINGEPILGSGNIVIPKIVYVPNEASMPNPPVEGVLYLIGEE